MKNLKKNNGITLVALIITIIVMLILAGISISTFTGDNGFITKAKGIRSNIEIAESEGQAKINSLQQAEYTVDGGTVIINDENAPTINSMEVTDITETSFKVKVNITETGSGLEKIKYSIDDGETYITPNDKQAKAYTFENLNVGFEEYKVKVQVTDVNNNSSYASKTIEKFKIGDYVNYTYDTVEEGYNLLAMYSGYDSDQTILQSGTTLRWRILNIDESTEQIQLVSENPSDNVVNFLDAVGYNNGVYLLNDICEKLYSNNNLGITARSLNLEDIEKHFTIEGIEKRNSYASYPGHYGSVYHNSIHRTINPIGGLGFAYPNLYEHEIGAGINTGIVQIPDLSITNPDPYRESNRYYTMPTLEGSSTVGGTQIVVPILPPVDIVVETSEQIGKISMIKVVQPIVKYSKESSEEDSDLTVTQTYYHIPIDSTNYGEAGDVLGNSNLFWIASRGTICIVNDSATFGLRCADTYMNLGALFNTYGSAKSAHPSVDIKSCGLRPVVSLSAGLIKGPKDENGVWNLTTTNE